MQTETISKEPQGNDVYNVLTSGVYLFAFLDMIDCSLEIRRYANQDNRWLAQIEHCEIKEGVILSGNYGTGKNPEQAIEDYVRQIKGKHIVVNAATKYRKEYHVPTNVYFACR
jgi:hypothetical protein